MFLDDNRTAELVLTIIAAIGALNWGVVSLFNANLLIDGLGMAAGSQQILIVYAVIGFAGAIVLIERVDDSEALS